MYRHRFVAMIALFGLCHCGAFVAPSDLDAAVDGSHDIGADASLDSTRAADAELIQPPPTCALPLQVCPGRGASCACGRCDNGSPSLPRADWLCLPLVSASAAPSGFGCAGPSRFTCHGVGIACQTTRDETSGVCLDVATCLAVTQRRQAIRGTAEIDRCTYSDGTVAVSGRFRQADCALDGRRSCGVGCRACDAGSSCVFVSERRPTGICVANTNATGVVACNGSAPRTLCPSGHGCLVAQLGDGEDADRVGACAPSSDCMAIAQGAPDRFVCKGDLHQ
jgi:hypothetical protein